MSLVHSRLFDPRGRGLLFSRAACRCFPAKVFDFVRGCGPRRIAGKPLLAGLKKVLRPVIIKVLDNPLTAAELRDALLPPQTLQHDAPKSRRFFGAGSVNLVRAEGPPVAPELVRQRCPSA